MSLLSLSFLGTFQVLKDGVPITTIESDRGRALLAYLSTESDRIHSRDALAALLWPEETRQTARRNLRQALFNLRKALDPDQTENPPYISASAHEIQFNVASTHWLDVAGFTTLLDATQGHEHVRLDACSVCMERIAQAVNLYKGDFLVGFSLPDSNPFEEWRLFKQEELRNRALDALTHISRYYERRQDFEQARHYLQRQIELEPWREEAHATLMRVFALQGQRTPALNQFAICRDILARELGIAPSQSTISLYEDIKKETISPHLLEIENPYRGLYAFEEEDATHFFGRETFTEQLLDAVNKQTSVILIGASGSGKSSVIRAGLYPRLRFAPQVGPYANGNSRRTTWTIIDFRPGSEPFLQLADAVTPLLQTNHDSQDLVFTMRTGEYSLATLADNIISAAQAPDTTPESNHRLLLTVDQFEELFALCSPETRNAFLDYLLPADSETTRPSRCTLLLTFRADFTSQAFSYRPLIDAAQQASLILGPMNRGELRRAVEEPARGQGVVFQPGLVERFLDDVGEEPGNLPLAQFALTLLWEKRSEGQLTHAAYDDIGGVQGALTSYAEHVYNRLGPDDQAWARRVVLQMVQPGETTEDTRRVVFRDELGDESWRLVQLLSDERLVVTDRDSEGREIAELVHEALILNWDRLRGWLDADRTFRTWQGHLRAAMHQWETSGYDDGALLRGALLAEAEQWLDDRPIDFSAQEQAFIRASMELRDKEIAEAEAQRHRELAQAQALAEAERKRANAEARASRRFRWLAAGLAIVFVLALLAAAQAVDQSRHATQNAELAQTAEAVASAERNRAEKQARLALSRQLAAQAINKLDDQLDLALLLNLESLRLSDSSSDRFELLTSFFYNPLIERFIYANDVPLFHLTYDLDGKRLISAGEHGDLAVWDPEKGQLKNTPLPDALAADLVAVSPDGGLAATAQENEITLWDLETGLALDDPVPEYNAEVKHIQFANNGDTLLTSSSDGAIILWDVRAGRPLNEEMTYNGRSIICLSPDGDTLIYTDIVEGQTRIYVWDAKTGELIGESAVGHTDQIHDIAFSPDGSTFATGSFDQSIRLWDLNTITEIGEPLEGHEGRVLSLAYSPDGSILASGGTDNQIILWDIATQKPLGPPLTGHDNWIRGLAFSPDGSHLASADAGGKIILWNLAQRRFLKGGHTDRVRSVALSPDGKVLLTAGFDRVINVWDAMTGEWIEAIPTEHTASIINIVYSPDGKTFTTGGADGSVIIWDANSRRPLHPPLSEDQAVIVGLAYSPDGRYVASGDFEGKVRLWDVNTGERIDEPVQAHDGWVMSLAFSPDGTLLASGGTDGSIRLMNIPSMELVAPPIIGHTNWVTALLFHPDGKTLISGSSDNTVRLWDLASGQAIGEPFTGHRAQVWSVLLDPRNENTIVSLSSDGSVIWWDMATHEPLSPPLNTYRESEFMMLGPEGQRLYLGSFVPEASIWYLDLRPWPEKACTIANRSLTREEWQHYLDDAPYQPACSDQS